MKKFLFVFISALVLLTQLVSAQKNDFEALKRIIDSKIDEVESEMIEWRRYFHEHPELSNMEYNTSAKIAAILSDLGLEVNTGIAKTGVTGLLVGGKPGPVIALRADMDALPVTEELELPYTSKVTAMVNGMETGVMHACGHDAHMAILLATAKILSTIKEDLPGSVKFIFQPAEEGASDGSESWGAEQMIREGVLKNPEPEVIFGLHVGLAPSGTINYNPDAMMASVDNFTITVHGKGTHGAKPWNGIDPIPAASAIVLNIQSIISRNVKLIDGAAVITVGSIHGGTRSNIISEKVELVGTIRTHNSEARELIHERLEEVVNNTALAYGTEADLNLNMLYPPLVNHRNICDLMHPTMIEVVGEENVNIINPVTSSEDFAYYLREIPGIFFFLGIQPAGEEGEKFEPNHSPRFTIEESAMKTGVKAFSYMVLGYMESKQ